MLVSTHGNNLKIRYFFNQQCLVVATSVVVANSIVQYKIQQFASEYNGIYIFSGTLYHCRTKSLTVELKNGIPPVNHA